MYSQMSELHNGTLEISSNFLVHRYVLKFRVPKHEPLWLFSLNNKKRIKEVQYNKNSLLLLKWHIKTLIINSFTAAWVLQREWLCLSHCMGCVFRLFWICTTSHCGLVLSPCSQTPATWHPYLTGIFVHWCDYMHVFLWQDQYFMSSSEFVYNS